MASTPNMDLLNLIAPPPCWAVQDSRLTYSYL